MSFLNIVKKVKFRWPLNPGYYADNADNYPGAQINPFHCCWRQRLGWVCAGITLPGSTSQCGAAAGAGPWIYYHHHHTRGGKSVQKPFISTFETFECKESIEYFFHHIFVLLFENSVRKSLKWLLLYDLKPCGWDAGRREQTEPQMRTVTLRTLTMAGRSISEIFNNEYNGRGWIWIRGW